MSAAVMNSDDQLFCKILNAEILPIFLKFILTSLPDVYDYESQIQIAITCGHTKYNKKIYLAAVKNDG